MGPNESKQHFKFDDDYHQNWKTKTQQEPRKATCKRIQLRCSAKVFCTPSQHGNLWVEQKQETALLKTEIHCFARAQIHEATQTLEESVHWNMKQGRQGRSGEGRGGNPRRGLQSLVKTWHLSCLELRDNEQTIFKWQVRINTHTGS